MHPGEFGIELVIQTASGVLTGRFGPREAVTLLASQAPQARSEAEVLAERRPEQAERYAALLTSIGNELAARRDGGARSPDLRSVVEEVDRVITALGTAPGS